MLQILSFGVEPVGNDPGRNGFPQVVATHGDNRHLGMQRAHMRDQFDTRHDWHIEICDEQIRYCFTQMRHCSSAIVCKGYFVPGRHQEHPQGRANSRIVVNDQDLGFGTVWHWLSLPSRAEQHSTYLRCHACAAGSGQYRTLHSGAQATALFTFGLSLERGVCQIEDFGAAHRHINPRLSASTLAMKTFKQATTDFLQAPLTPLAQTSR